MLYGRQAERKTLAQLLDGACNSRSGVLVLRGEAGVGKSALLADAVAAAEGMRVVRALGVESESELPYAGLHQVVWPLVRQLDGIPAPQSRALRGALGLAAVDVVDRFLVSAALVSLLAAAAEDQPLLCVVDDAHWLDDPSAAALTFAARRLQAEPVAILFAFRDADDGGFEAAGIPELVVEGIDSEAAFALLEAQAGEGISADVRSRIVASARGNPLALIELPHALTPEELSGLAPLADELPLTSTIERSFLRRAEGLGESARKLLLIAAADDTGDAAVVFAAAEQLGIDKNAFSETEDARLLRLRDQSVEFRHPLVRSAIYSTASFAERQATHQLLADVLDSDDDADRRAWHLAAATLGTNDVVAGELEQSASRAAARSGYGAAAVALERAAALTPTAAERSRRLLAAARAAWLAGQVEKSRVLLGAAGRLAEDPTLQADIDHLRALLELQCGVPAVAHELLIAASDLVADSEPPSAAAMLVAAGEAAAFAGNPDGEIEAGRRAELLQKTLSVALFELTMMSGISRLLSGDAVGGAELLRETIEELETSDNPRRFFWAGSTSLYLLDTDSARRYFAAAVDEARADGAMATLALGLQMLGHTEVLASRFSAAITHASEGLRLARDTGQENGACHNLSVLTWAHGALGDEEACRRCGEETLALASLRGLGLQASFALIGLGELQLGLGRADDAVAQFEAHLNAGPGGAHAAMKLLMVPSYVEASIKAGRRVAAEAAVPAYEAWVESTGSVAELARLRRTKALLETDTEAATQFTEALDLHAKGGSPFERARTQLAFGEMLRRSRKRAASREHLRAALETFEQLRAVSWAERARAELRASGETARKRDPSTVDELTAQERQIARLVAAGATNKEVAAQLFLSPRTIDFHLRNVFAKLGIASRHELTRFGFGDEEEAVPAAGPAISPVRA